METVTVEPLYLNYEQAETLTSVHRVTIWRAVKNGELRASGSGRGVRFRRDELIRWMDERK